MEAVSFGLRCTIMFFVCWLGIRLIGKKSIAQMTSYELAGILLLSTAAAEPLVYKIPAKATEAVFIVVFITILVGKLSLSKKYYNADMKPSLLIINGKIDKEELKKNNMNLPFLFSQLRLKNYASVSEIEYAIIEPNGQLSVIPKSQERAIKPKDMQIETKYEGLGIPLILDGEIQYNNLKFMNLNVQWLDDEVQKVGGNSLEEVFLAQIDTQGKLYVDLYHDIDTSAVKSPEIF